MELIAKNICKSFGVTKAVDNVAVKLCSGEVRAIVGENGAGKSTLLKIIAGAHSKDSGEIYIDGEFFNPTDLMDASGKGVTIVFQETTINPSLTIAENIFIDRLREFKKMFGVIDWKKIKSSAQKILDDIGADISVNRNIQSLDLGQWKIIEIARALSYNPKVLLLDESTAFLSNKEATAFLTVIEKLKNSGMAIGFVSHHMNEIFEIADKITIMKDGKWVSEHSTSEVTSKEIETLMVGREIGENFYPSRNSSVSKDIVLSTENLSVKGVLSDINLSLYKGEILGIGGLKGCGGEDVLRTIYGDTGFDKGRILLDHDEYKPKKPYHALANGVALVPGERTLEGLISGFPVINNISMAAIPKKGLLINKKAEYSIAIKYINDLKIKTSSPFLPCSSLSGGNMQKVVIGKCLATKPKILLLNNPTRGIDVGARHEIYNLIRGLSEEGMSIILLSEDLLELIGMSDRIYVMRRGKISGIFSSDELPSEEDLISHML